MQFNNESNGLISEMKIQVDSFIHELNLLVEKCKSIIALIKSSNGDIKKTPIPLRELSDCCLQVSKKFSPTFSEPETVKKGFAIFDNIICQIASIATTLSTTKESDLFSFLINFMQAAKPEEKEFYDMDFPALENEFPIWDDSFLETYVLSRFKDVNEKIYILLSVFNGIVILILDWKEEQLNKKRVSKKCFVL